MLSILTLILSLFSTNASADFLSPQEVELHRLVDRRTDQGRAFERYCQDLLVSIFPQDRSEIYDTQIYFLAEQNLNAYYSLMKGLDGRTIHLIFITKGTVQAFKSEEGFLTFLGHEWIHAKGVLKMGLKHRNSPAEEMAADLIPFTAMNNNGRNVAAAFYELEEVSKKLIKERGRAGMNHFFDIHPIEEGRMKAAQAQVAAMSLKRGGYAGIATVPLNSQKTMRDLMGHQPHRSFIDQRLSQWSVQSESEKLLALTEVLSSTTQMTSVRVRDLKSYTLTLPITDELRRWLNDLIFKFPVLHPDKLQNVQLVIDTLNAAPSSRHIFFKNLNVQKLQTIFDNTLRV